MLFVNKLTTGGTEFAAGHRAIRCRAAELFQNVFSRKGTTILSNEHMEHLQNQMGFEAFRHAYRAAIKEVRTKIEILSEDFAVRHDYNPIHHMERRLKVPESI